MSQNRYKGIECDQCGRCGQEGLRLNFSVEDVSTHGKKRKIEAASFFATFCCKECIQKFLIKHYFDSVWELEDTNVNRNV